MTRLEILLIRALDRCRFGYRPFDVRFINNLRRQTVHDPDSNLTSKQRYALASIAYRYRRQLVRFVNADHIPTAPPKPEQFGLDDPPLTVADLFTGEETPPHESNIDKPPHIQQGKLF